LLLVPGRIWPILIPAAFATFALYDLEAGVPVKSIAWFLPANTVEVLTSALCLRYSFNGVPRLDSVKALAKYSFFAVILAPVGAAFFSANGIGALIGKVGGFAFSLRHSLSPLSHRPF
jgi:hypothetical protein